MNSDAAGTSRIANFEDGVKAMDEKDFDTAVSSFQKCMKKLSNQGLGLMSELFPKCLQNIATCYSEKGDMENALSFKKFEKLYYETVLLHNGLDGLVMKDSNGDSVDYDSQSSRDRGDGSSEASTQESVNNEEGQDTPENRTPKRASEYEQLAQLCLQQDCISLALEYSGKATLLNRHHYGDEHEKTKKSFELFTSVYAEAGKKQYSESMEQFNLESNLPVSSPAAVEETLLRHRRNVSKKAEDTEGDSGTKPLKRTRSILKKRTSNENMVQSNSDQPAADAPRRVTFADPLPQMVRLRDDDETDNSTTNLLLFILICILIILVSVLISAIFCQINPTMAACVDFRREITYYYNRVRYLYRSYIK